MELKPITWPTAHTERSYGWPASRQTDWLLGYAVASILMAVVIQLVYPGVGGGEVVSVPILLTGGLVSSLVINAVWALSSDGFATGNQLGQAILKSRYCFPGSVK